MEVSLFKRLLSSAIDAAIIYVISVTFAGEIYGRLVIVGGFSNSGPASRNILIAYEVFAAVFVFLIYYSFLESKFGSSVGKFIFNISVTDNSGNKPSFNQALLRSFSKLNPYTFYSLIIGVNSRHDKVAQTVVVNSVNIYALFFNKIKPFIVLGLFLSIMFFVLKYGYEIQSVIYFVAIICTVVSAIAWFFGEFLRRK